MGHLTNLTVLSVVVDIVRKKFSLAQNPMVSNIKESGYCIHHQQGQFTVLFVNFLPLKIPRILLKEKGSVTGEMLSLELTVMKQALLTETLC